MVLAAYSRPGQVELLLKRPSTVPQEYCALPRGALECRIASGVFHSFIIVYPLEPYNIRSQLILVIPMFIQLRPEFPLLYPGQLYG